GVAGYEAGQPGGRRHDRLPGPDVALEQAVHREWRRHVAPDLAPHALLGTGEAIGQRGTKPAHEIAGRIERDAARAGRTRAQDRQAELEEQEVVEGEAAGRRR